jgi:hypothetical protein
MTTTRKQHSTVLKARVAMETIRGEKTLSQQDSQVKVHPIQIGKWRSLRWSNSRSFSWTGGPGRDSPRNPGRTRSMRRSVG